MAKKIKRSNVPKYGTGGDVLNSLGGIANMIPGWGALIGGALNTAGGIVNNNESMQTTNDDLLKAQNKTQWDIAKKDHTTSALGTQAFANGGSFLTKMNAPSHANGGAMVDGNGNPTSQGIAEVEKDETILKGKDSNFAFSPNLIDAVTGKTFAKASKSVESKLKSQLNDGNDIANRTRKSQFKRLQKSNEVQKQQIDQMTMAIQDKLSQPIQMANGGSFGDPIKGLPITNLKNQFEINNTRQIDNVAIGNKDIIDTSRKVLSQEEKARLIQEEAKQKEIENARMYNLKNSTPWLANEMRTLNKNLKEADTNEYLKTANIPIMTKANGGRIKKYANGGGLPKYDNGGDLFPMPKFDFNSTMGIPGTDGTRLFNAGIEGANLNNKLGDYTPTFDFDYAKTMYKGDEKGLQTKMKDYLAKTGDDYKMGKVDGDLGKMTKGFFDDQNRVTRFAKFLGFQMPAQGEFPGATPGYYSPRNANRLVSPITTNFNATPQIPVDEKELLNKAISGKNYDTLPFGVTIPNMDYGKVTLADAPVFDKKEGQRMQNQIAANKTKEGLKKFGKGIGDVAKDVYDGKFDRAIGLGAKAAEMIASGIAAFRNPDQIPLHKNPNALEAEDVARSSGISYNQARQSARESLNTNRINSQNAMSNAVKLALNQNAQNQYVGQMGQIATEEKAARNQQNANVSNLLNNLGVQDVASRNLQEMLQSQTNAVSADAKKTFAESVGNMGEFFLNKDVKQRESNETIKLLNNQYKDFNIPAANLAEYNRLLSDPNADETELIVFAKRNGITAEQAKKDKAKFYGGVVPE